MSNSFYVYRLCFPNGKSYIGITTSFKKRMRAHKHKENSSLISPLHNAIKKYKWENIQVFVLSSNISEEDAYNEEKRLIKEMNLTNIYFGYNLDIGGRTRFGSKNRVPAWNKGKKLSQSHVLNLKKAKENNDYSEISSNNSTLYSVVAKDLTTGLFFDYRNVTDFCEKNNVKNHAVYNHIRRNSRVLDKKWNVRYKQTLKK